MPEIPSHFEFVKGLCRPNVAVVQNILDHEAASSQTLPICRRPQVHARCLNLTVTSTRDGILLLRFLIGLLNIIQTPAAAFRYKVEEPPRGDSQSGACCVPLLPIFWPAAMGAVALRN